MSLLEAFQTCLFKPTQCSQTSFQTLWIQKKFHDCDEKIPISQHGSGGNKFMVLISRDRKRERVHWLLPREPHSLVEKILSSFVSNFGNFY